MLIDSFTVGPWQTNCYLFGTGGQCVVIDAGVGAYQPIMAALRQRNLALAGVIATHGHIDHIADAARLANEAGVPMYWHSADDYMMTRPSAGLGAMSAPLMVQLFGADALPKAQQSVDLRSAQRVELAGLGFDVVETPGHTPGSVILTSDFGDGPVALTGDTIFAGSVGRTDLPGGDPTVLDQTLRHLLGLIDDATGLLPGHGPATTMAVERRHNQFLLAASR